MSVNKYDSCLRFELFNEVRSRKKKNGSLGVDTSIPLIPKLKMIISVMFCTHSFRKGGATALLAAGVDIATIKYLGRWRSMAWLLYASVSDNSLERAAQALASF